MNLLIEQVRSVFLPSWHYYECLVTIAPVFGERLDYFRAICKRHRFSSGTGRSLNYAELAGRIRALLADLRNGDFEVLGFNIQDKYEVRP